MVVLIGFRKDQISLFSNVILFLQIIEDMKKIDLLYELKPNDTNFLIKYFNTSVFS